jgi:wyosine [tRNA(Phe)-imidazoG37] synthetase (radical SAM superfamily)
MDGVRASSSGPPPMPSVPLAFGPVRSRRLGWSLGINNVPPKTCTYSCVYCQVGATDRARLVRRAFYAPGDIAAAVAARLAECRATAQPIDVATFVPDGEPTLDRDLGAAIRGVAALGLRVAVLTNGSLLWREDVRADLRDADWVSVKVDSVEEVAWRRVNRPIGGIALETVLDGIRMFVAEYRGELVTETMLVAGVNDDDMGLRGTAAFISALEPFHAYVTIPTRPPAEPWVRAPSAQVVAHAVDMYRRFELPTSPLVEDIEDEEVSFATAEDPVQGLLGILAVHPMSEAAVDDYLARSGADRSVARALLESGRIVTVPYRGRSYLRAALPHADRHPRSHIAQVVHEETPP